MAGASTYGHFEVTRWTLVLRAAQGGQSPEGRHALEELCRLYWDPVYAFVRRSGHSREDGQDLTQEFFARLLAKNDLAQADRSKGRFRSFLLTAIKHFLANEWDRSRALKRGGSVTFVPLEVSDSDALHTLDPGHELTPEKMFERQWALTLLGRVLARLGAEYAEDGREKTFATLKPFLTDDAAPGTTAEIATRLGISEGSLKVTIHRLRRRYRELLRAEIAQTVGDPSEVDEEIRHLFSAFA